MSSSTRGPLYNNEWSEGNGRGRKREERWRGGHRITQTLHIRSYTIHTQTTSESQHPSHAIHPRITARWPAQVGKPGDCELIAYPILLSPLFFCLRGGVTGRPVFAPYGYFAFFSAGFRILKEMSAQCSEGTLAAHLEGA